MKKSNFQTVDFVTILVTMNEHTYELFNNAFNYVLIEVKGGINNGFKVTYPKMFFNNISAEWLKSKLFN